MSASNPAQENQNQFKTPLSIKDFDILAILGNGSLQLSTKPDIK